MRAFVRDGDSRVAAEGRGEITVQSLALHGQWQPVPRVIHAESGTKEVANRHFYGGVSFAVPIHAQDQFAQVELAGEIDGHPDVANGTGATDTENCNGLSGLDRDGIDVASLAVDTRGAFGDRIAQSGDAAEWAINLCGCGKAKDPQEHFLISKQSL